MRASDCTPLPSSFRVSGPSDVCDGSPAPRERAPEKNHNLLFVCAAGIALEAAWPSRRSVVGLLSRQRAAKRPELVQRGPGSVGAGAVGLGWGMRELGEGTLRELRGAEKRESGVRLGRCRCRGRDPRSPAAVALMAGTTLLPAPFGSDALLCNPFCRTGMLRLREGCDRCGTRVLFLDSRWKAFPRAACRARKKLCQARHEFNTGYKWAAAGHIWSIDVDYFPPGLSTEFEAWLGPTQMFRKHCRS